MPQFHLRSQSNRRSRPGFRLGGRHGAAAVEFALTAPLFFLFLFAGMEFSRANILRNLCDNAALEGARAGVVPGATADRCIATANRSLEILGVRNATVEVEPDLLTPSTRELTVRVTIPMSDNALPMSQFVLGHTLEREATLKRSGVARETNDP